MVSDHTRNPKVDLSYRRKKNAEEMKMQVISFVLMIFLTIIAFITVGYDDIDKWFRVPFIVLLACVQAIFQLYYFMHMSHKGHEAPQLFIWTGVFITFLTVLAMSTIVWW